MLPSFGRSVSLWPLFGLLEATHDRVSDLVAWKNWPEGNDAYRQTEGVHKTESTRVMFVMSLNALNECCHGQTDREIERENEK